MMETLTWKTLAKPTFIIILLIGSINLLISHSFLPTYKEQMSGISKEGKLLTKRFNEKSNNLMIKFKNGVISKDEFLKGYSLIKKEKAIEIKAFKTKRQNVRETISYYGYKNKRLYLFWVGIAFFVFAISFRLASKVINESSIFDKIEALIYLSISGFMLTWALTNFQDYTNITYMFVMFISNIVIVTLGFYLFRHYTTIEYKLKMGIQLLIKYISVDLYNQREDKESALISDLNKYEELNNIVDGKK